MVARWRERVSEAERREYGAGILGALLLILAERRLPVTARHTGRTLVRVGIGVTVALVALFVTLIVAVAAVAVALF